MKPTAPDPVNASDLATAPLPWLISVSLDDASSASKLYKSLDFGLE